MHRRRTISTTLAAVLGLTALGAGTFLQASPAAADTWGPEFPTPTCLTGTYTVPSGSRYLRVDAIGGAGRGGYTANPTNTGGPGGAGAHVTAFLPVSGGQQLKTVVGHNGDPLSPSAGFPNGGPTDFAGGKGGGASVVTTAAGDPCLAATADRSQVLVVAGGGGGGGGASPFGSGGAGGTAGADYTGNGQSGHAAYQALADGGSGGGGGSATGAGNGGAGGCAIYCGIAGFAGSGSTGGKGPTFQDQPTGGADGAGGAGGGGWYGGGGGGAGNNLGGGGGGSGSSYTAPSAPSAAVSADTTDAPSVTMTPVATPTTTAVLQGATPGNGWYTTDATIELTVQPGTYGVDATYYALNNPACSATNLSACVKYSGPVPISTDGLYTLTYFSMDGLNLDEEMQTRTFAVAHSTVGVSEPDIGSGDNPNASSHLSAESVVAVGVGRGMVGTAFYDANPAGAPTFNSTGAYAAVLASGADLHSLTVYDCRLNGGTKVFWWSGASWASASNQTYDATRKCVAVTVDMTTSPSINQLTNTVLAAASPPSLDLAPATVPSPTSGTAYDQALTASGGVAPYSFQVSGGTLPAGLSLASDGTLSGTATAYGPFSFTVRATDADGTTGTKNYSMGIATPVLVLPSTVPGGTFGQSYDDALVASGGTAPYVYSLASRALPPGLTLDSATGVLSGTPTAAGDFTFTLKAVDSGSGTGPAWISKAYSVTIAKAAPPLLTVDAPDGVVGQSAAVSASGTAGVTFSSATPTLCSVVGSTVTYLHAGACQVHADQAATDNVLATAADGTALIAQADTTLGLVVHPTTLVATVGVVAPGAGGPSGMVTFQVGGITVGSAPVSAGVATLTYTVPAGRAQQVNAVYSGDTDFAGSSASTARNDPTITAAVTSARALSHGWYRTPITVTFTCVTNGAPLTAACPAPVTLSRDGGGLSVTRTITSTDGGAATVSVTGLNLDQTAPALRVGGVRNGAVYTGTVPAATCLATDRLSGVASCRIRLITSGEVTRFNATAVDRAGNQTVVTGSYRVPRLTVWGTPFANGAFQVKVSGSYTLVVTHSALRPRYVNAAPYPGRPTGLGPFFTKVGPGKWAMTVKMSSLGRNRTWNLGILIGSTLHVARVHTA